MMKMRQTQKLSILIVDDHLLVRLGLRLVLSHEYRAVVFGEAGTAEKALAQIRAHPWRLVILGDSLPDNDSFSVLREFRTLCPEAAVLMLSMHGNSAEAAHFRQLGAAGYISAKSCGRSDLLKAFRSVLNGEKHFSERILRGSDLSPVLHANLSAQEFKVLLALAAGRRTGEIAAELTLSAKTVSTYKRRALDKLGLKSTADLVRYVIDHKLPSMQTCKPE
ncbi:MAG: response regulator transcription factor [Acidobacteriia bacterium]|nr:response regulator transcription factor [Terriglobia bacterium]